MFFAPWGAHAPQTPPGWGAAAPQTLPRGVWVAAAAQSGGSGGREPPRERKLIQICFRGRRPGTFLAKWFFWVREGSPAGVCWVRFWGLAGPGGPGRSSNLWGTQPPHLFEGLFRAPGVGQTSKMHPNTTRPDCLQVPRLSSHFCILVFGLHPELATKLLYNWSRVPTFGAFCIISQA